MTRSHFGGEFPIPIDTVGIMGYNYLGAGSLYFDDGIFPWKLADDFSEDARWGYPRWKVVLGRMLGRGKR